MNKLIEALKKVKDFRKDKGKRHSLWLVLLIIILGIMSGHTSYRALGGFVRANQYSLIHNFNILPQRVPSYSTIRRVVEGVDWSNLINIFNQWAAHLTDDFKVQDWIAIDGKSLKSTVTNYDNHSQNFVAMLSLFSQNTGLVLALSCWENKLDSEIYQVRDAIKTSAIKGHVLTLDALHCQKETTQTICETENDYIIPVKLNQKKLYQSLKTVSENGIPLSCYQEKDNSHGRNINRRVTVFDAPVNLDPKWCKLQSFILVERSGTRGTKIYHEIVYYISSLSETAEMFAKKIRGHWLIENQLHWVKDVIFTEDNTPIKNYQANINFSILKTIALNLFRFLGFLSITEGQRWLNHRWSKLLVLLE